MKKLFVIFFIFLFIFSNNVLGTEDVLNISSPNAILMEQSTKRVLYGKNERKKVKIASTTKILTAIVAIENASLDEIVTIQKNAVLTGGSTVGLKLGSEVTLEALMYGMLLKSGNDCAVAIAEYIGGSVENFAKMMNKKAYEIGAKDTHCTNPHGLDTDSNYSTAYDLAIITCYAKANETLAKILGTKQINIKLGKSTKYLANTNRLLSTYEYCDGGKTGFTNIANRCLVATAKKDELAIVAVVLGAETTDIRFRDGKELLKYGIENYKMINVGEYVNWYIDVPIYKGNIYSYVSKFNSDICLPLKSGELEKIYISQNIVSSLNAPVKRGSYLGDVELYIDNELLYNSKIYTTCDIRKNTVLDYMLRGIKGIFEMGIVV